MQVLKDPAAVDQLEDTAMRQLIQQRVHSAEPYEMQEVCFVVVVQPGDTVEAISAAVGFDILSNRHTGLSFDSAGFTPSHEVIEEHLGFYEMVFVLSDDGFGVLVMVPKVQGVSRDLLAMCTLYATHAEVT